MQQVRSSWPIEEPATPLMIIRHKEGGVTIEDLKDNIELIAQVKEGDYDYPEYVIPSGIVLDHIGKKVEGHDLFEVAYRYRDTPFQLIPILRDLRVNIVPARQR